MTNQALRVVQVTNAPRVRRVARKPQHKFNLKAKPFEIVPFMIAPVLPGETMQSLLAQSRVVTDPIHNALIGWWKEYYWFYVTHRTLGALTDTDGLLQAMMLDPSTDVSDLKAGANGVPLYNFKTGMIYTEACYRAVVQEFFRDEEEAYSAASIENYYAAQIDQEGWHHSLMLEGTGVDDDELPGVDELEEQDVLTGFSGPYAQWELMRDAGMTDLTYDDYLKSYGVSVPKEESVEAPTRHVPELVRFSRSWTYPTNHVDPATGAPSSACSWSVAERADKKRFFKEPGFLFGVTVTRPKIYLGSQKGAAVGLLNNAYTWLPAVLDGHPYISVTEQLDSGTDGILQNQAADYWIDVRDLFLYGDQFVNHTMGAAANHGIALPTATLDKKYPTEAMVDSLFKTEGSEYVREDGVVHLNILGRQRDATP